MPRVAKIDECAFPALRRRACFVDRQPWIRGAADDERWHAESGCIESTGEAEPRRALRRDQQHAEHFDIERQNVPCPG
jgi:hypothetical protein